jgi:hypothetical protein
MLTLLMVTRKRVPADVLGAGGLVQRYQTVLRLHHVAAQRRVCPQQMLQALQPHGAAASNHSNLTSLHT